MAGGKGRTRKGRKDPRGGGKKIPNGKCDAKTAGYFLMVRPQA